MCLLSQTICTYGFTIYVPTSAVRGHQPAGVVDGLGLADAERQVGEQLLHICTDRVPYM